MIVMAPFTCLTCRVAYEELELQKLHYKSDWHRYNLKRKVAELPPIGVEEFQKRVYNEQHKQLIANQDKTLYCKVCRKHFSNDKVYENHVNSKKHKLNELSCLTSEENFTTERDEPYIENDNSELEVEEVDSDEWDEENPIDFNNCLFCLHHSRNLIRNLQHMMQAHTFFIPDVEYCVDLLGLLHYLGEKVSKDFMCLWCNENGKTFHSAEAARNHMVDKGHCKMLHEGITLAEYADYYDYSTSYPDADSNADPDEEVEIAKLDDSEYQLVLPSGVTVGHRSLMRYYKQKLNPDSTVQVSRNTSKLHRVLAEYRSLGWTQTQQEIAARKARDIHYMKRVQAKWSVKLGSKGNKTRQPHFRSQINF